jgi:hypothetical protein
VSHALGDTAGAQSQTGHSPTKPINLIAVKPYPPSIPCRSTNRRLGTTKTPVVFMMAPWHFEKLVVPISDV